MGDAVSKAMQEAIAAAAESVDFEGISREAIEKGVTSTFEDLFTWNGAGYKALKNALTEALVPQIEKFDFAAYIPKLDAVLAAVADAPVLARNQQMLGNFRKLFEEPADRITFESLFDEYKRFVSENADCYDREIDFDGVEPAYLPVSVSMVPEMGAARFSTFREYATLSFSVEPGLENAKKLAKRVELFRWRDDPHWRVDTPSAPSSIDIMSLSRMDDFDLCVLRLVQDGTLLEGEPAHMEDEVEPCETPEPDYH